MNAPLQVPVQARDGHTWQLQTRVPPAPAAALLWLPALGTAARHYLPFADVLADRGVAVFVHEWRGHGSSDLRAGRGRPGGDWGYRELLTLDLPASQAALATALPAKVPVVLGGHSLGGQLACCRLALDPDAASALWLVASGSPCPEAFPTPARHWLPAAYRLLPWLARAFGALPGRRIGFGGREAPGLIADWARTARTGRYQASGLAVDLEGALGTVDLPARCAVFADDWLAPVSSLDFLLRKMPRVDAGVTMLDAHVLGARADHFAWMRHPGRVADALLG